MNGQYLAKIKGLLEKVLRELDKVPLSDARIRQRYAEYLVAATLAKKIKGWEVQILDDREKTSADICLFGQNGKGIMVEVKSGKVDKDGWVCASFSQGNQIKKKRFDYCVFVTFDKKREKVLAQFVFELAELKEVAQPRKRLAAFGDSNPCLLCYPPSLGEYKHELKQDREPSFDIERELLRNPKKYRNAWRKIKQGCAAL